MKQDYYLGLDIGTNSVGWAVSSTDYKILRKKGVSLWGVRLFDEAKTAKDRRNFRTSRRRLDRLNWRINLLQEVLGDKINKVDPGFFLRMKESKYYPEDKLDLTGNTPLLPYALFCDNNFTDKNYHKLFPTIYHLRYKLMFDNDINDIRLMYLAIHHIIKHRGHFLFQGSLENIQDFTLVFNQFLNTIISEELDFNLSLNSEDIEDIKTILENKNLSKSEKKSALIKVYNAKTKCEKALFTLISGGKVSVADIFNNTEYENLCEAKICFTDSTYDEYITNIEDVLNDKFIIISVAKALYDWSVLSFILGSANYLSESKVSAYEKHQKDLRYLKQLVLKNLTKEEYRNIFVITDPKINNYPAYIGSTKINGKKTNLKSKKCSKEDFYKFLTQEVINKIDNKDDLEYLLSEINNENFLPKLKVTENAVLPHQVHLIELKMILKNMVIKNIITEDEMDKILSIFTFKIPYYVGPLNNNDSINKFSWMIRKENGRILPWNFEEKVDVDKSAEIFIRRMTNKCTYLIGEDVLPKNSLLYSKYMVLNELNNIVIDGVKLKVEIKQKIYTELFSKVRNVTIKKLRNFLIKDCGFPKEFTITGIDDKINSSLASYHDLKEKLSNFNYNEQDFEKIILNITLFGADKKLLKKRLKMQFPSLTDKQLDSLSSLNYSGWGKFSFKFLQGIFSAFENDNKINILDMLWNTDCNLMQLLSKKYEYLSEIDQHNSTYINPKFSYDLVNNLYISPSVKRPVWQSLLIVKEIEKIMGCAPKRFFVEVARGKTGTGKTISRKNQLMDLYKYCKKTLPDLLEHLNNFTDSDLRGDKLYLYFIQQGRCMYSGEPIDINDLWNNNLYDIDHIHPQSVKFDDSLDNRVLVKKVLNENKTNIYPLSVDIQNKQRNFWNILLNKGFISKEKYNRLVRTEPFSDDELASFIERQIVETSQSNKAVAELLKQLYPDSTIVYSKAKNVSRFRQKYEFIKMREINDYHHAKDAYLNIVVGNVYHVKFNGNAFWYIKNNHGRGQYNLNRMFDFPVKWNDDVAWCEDSLGIVKYYYNRNDILVTRKSYIAQGGFFDQQIMKKGKGQFPVKGSDLRLSDIGKYGGFNKVSSAYFVLVSHINNKGKISKSFEYVPVYLVKAINENNNILIDYLTNVLGLINPVVLIDKVKINSLIEVDGFKTWITGRTGDNLILVNSQQLILNNLEIKVLKSIVRVGILKNTNEISSYDQKIVTEENLMNIYNLFINKLQNSVYRIKYSGYGSYMSDNIEKFVNLDLIDKCKLLCEILKFYQCKSGASNLVLIGGKEHCGILGISKNIDESKKMYLINQSITGVFEKRINLNKL